LDILGLLLNIKFTNIKLSRFIIIRGLDTLTNVFLHIFYFTKNIDLTYYHCQKSFNFYVEFVCQITEEEKMFLQLSSRDATTYVYKKTLFEINEQAKVFKINDDTQKNKECKEDKKEKNDKKDEDKEKEQNPNNFRENFDTIKIYINIYQTYLLKIINSKNLILSVNDNFVKLDASIAQLIQLIKMTEKINNTVLQLHDFTFHKEVKNTFQNKGISTSIRTLITIENITDKLYNVINDDFIDEEIVFFNINKLLIKKICKTPTIINNVYQKLNEPEIHDKITELTNEKFVIWLVE